MRENEHKLFSHCRVVDDVFVLNAHIRFPLLVSLLYKYLNLSIQRHHRTVPKAEKVGW